ncbi:hypothetical protein FRC15_007623 [Serendipita sp. 397]|nr:hypothetical protein FRC15_007623 [Serendipita sp. 397]KAG8826923.1 hypothetical protein FRC18_009974 [Serendipita sp. 400]
MDSYTRTLVISGAQLPTPARLLFTFGELTGEYNGVYPVIWKAVLFPPGNSPPSPPLIYNHQLAFSHPLVTNDIITDSSVFQIMSYGEKTALQKDDKGNYSFSTPVQGQPALLQALNRTGLDENLTLGFIPSPIPETAPTPTVFYDHVGDGSSLVIGPFSPKLYAYVTLQYEEGEIIRGKPESSFIWEQDLGNLPIVSNWLLKFDPTKVQYSLVRA